MANDSQRGYLSGILQRGARPMGPANRSAHMLPVVPRAPQVFSPHAHVNDSPAVDAPGESPSQVVFVGAEQSLEQSSQLAHPQALELRHSNTNAAEASSERSALDVPTPDVLRPDSKSVDSSLQRADLSLAGVLNPLLPIKSATQLEVTPAQQAMGSWEQRTPRLINAERAEEAVAADNSASNSKEARTDIDDREDRKRVLASQSVADSPFEESERASPIVRPQSRRGLNNPNQLATTPHGEDRSAAIESKGLLSERRVSLADNAQSQELAAVHQFVLEESGKSAPGHPREVGDRVAFGAPDSIEPGLEIVLASVQAEPREESLVWHASPRAQAEGQLGRQQYQPPREEAPKLTINRLDVQVINQSAAPVVQAPPPTPAPQSDNWENLDRYHLGNLNVIF